MASTRANLLTLPQEIRDDIYGYLHQKSRVFYRFSATHTLFARIENATLLSVQLVHSQLRNEYRSAACFRKSQVGVGLQPCTRGSVQREVDFARGKAMLWIVQHVTFLADLTPASRLSSTDYDAIKHIMSVCLRLDSLRLVFRESLSIHHHTDLARVLSTRLSDLYPEVATPQLEINRVVALRRRACGFQVGHPKRFPQGNPQWKNALWHQIYRIAVYLYALDGAELIPGVFKDLLPPVLGRPYPPILLADLSKHERQRIEGFATRVFQWKVLWNDNAA
ncbi:hypothetical protein IQ06DRAFT_351033 [Phaeosphaeriaceae sp. SRC1lsM3a]|nr:hypothetical protein IQ06DRAFT_351033 [Stagonospora sp. SRC1lsM3a]